MADQRARLAAALGDRYGIERELGAGGMATVYLAHDLRHDRHVALKVLRPELAAVIGAERFLHEIRVTANLQHPHILQLYDSGEADSLLYYVMPYVRGESLRDRLDREKQLPIDESLSIVTAVASALDYAHRRDVIHRDIKPENILLQDGQPVVADFGIALAVSSAGDARLTETGLSLGTPQYMSPEQAMGDRQIDGRTDVYSLACVLYEMLLGDPPFTGSTAQAIVAQILTGEADTLTGKRSTVPAHVDASVRKALSTIPADRFQTAGQFAEALDNPALAPPPPTVRTMPQGPWKVVATVSASVAVAALVFASSSRLRTDVTGPTTYDVGLPDSVPMAFKAYRTPAFAVAPDGTFVVYVGRRAGAYQLWYRSLSDDLVRPITGTEDGTAPTISPDGTRVAFRAGGQLKAVPIGGGPATVVADITDPAGVIGAADNRILLADHDGNLLRWIDPETGELGSLPERCVLARPTPGEIVLCGGGSMRFGQVLSPGDSTMTPIIQATEPNATGALLLGSDFRLLDERHLTYVSRGGDLRAVALDRTSFTAGRPVTMVAGVRREGLYGAAQYGVADDGTLVYAPGADAEVGRLVRVAADGETETLPMEQAAFLRFDLSPDGRTLAAVVRGVGEQELRIYDMDTGDYAVWQRGQYVGEPLWDPAGERIMVFIVPRGGRPVSIFGSPTASSPPDTLPQAVASPVGFSADARLISWSFPTLQALALNRRTSPPILDTLANSAYFPALSPDDRWLAYQDRSTGQLLLEPQPSRDRRFQVADEAWEPRWLSDAELVYWIEDTWYRVTIGEDPDRPVGEAQVWFTDPRFSDTLGESYMITPDGEIIYVQGPEQTTASYLRVVPDWADKVRGAVAGEGGG